MGKALPDGLVLHAGDPEPQHGLGTLRQIVDVAEDEFALPPGVAGIDDLSHVRPIHEAAQQRHLLLAPWQQLVLPGGGQNGQITLVPFFVLRVVGDGVSQSPEVAEAPGNQIPPPLQVAVLTAFYPKHSSIAHGNRRFLSDN